MLLELCWPCMSVSTAGISQCSTVVTEAWLSASAQRRDVGAPWRVRVGCEHVIKSPLLRNCSTEVWREGVQIRDGLCPGDLNRALKSIIDTTCVTTVRTQSQAVRGGGVACRGGAGVRPGGGLGGRPRGAAAAPAGQQSQQRPRGQLHGAVQ